MIPGLNYKEGSSLKGDPVEHKVSLGTICVICKLSDVAFCACTACELFPVCLGYEAPIMWKLLLPFQQNVQCHMMCRGCFGAFDGIRQSSSANGVCIGTADFKDFSSMLAKKLSLRTRTVLSTTPVSLETYNYI